MSEIFFFCYQIRTTMRIASTHLDPTNESVKKYGLIATNNFITGLEKFRRGCLSREKRFGEESYARFDCFCFS